MIFDRRYNVIVPSIQEVKEKTNRIIRKNHDYVEMSFKILLNFVKYDNSSNSGFCIYMLKMVLY